MDYLPKIKIPLLIEKILNIFITHSLLYTKIEI